VQRAPFAVLCKALLRLLPLRPVLRTPIDLARLLHRIRVIRPDVMYVKTVTIPLWSIAARLARKPVVLHVHEAETNAAKPLRAGLNAPLDLRERSLIMVTYARDAAARRRACRGAMAACPGG
jgi:hypothetical protein